MSKLYIVPTPIGNLEDITIRAINVLKEVDLVLAEDTRVTQKLFSVYDIKTQIQSYHSFNEHKIIDNIISKIQSGVSIALVSDAGTPGISDPGYLITKKCIDNNIEIECLPGATALIPALVKSGFPTDRFCFEGFLPQKKGRQKKFNELKEEKRTIILYESPHRLLKTLEQIKEFFGLNREISVSRELTKIYEETINGNVEDLISYFSKKNIKGEIVIIIKSEGKKDSQVETDE